MSGILKIVHTAVHETDKMEFKILNGPLFLYENELSEFIIICLAMKSPIGDHVNAEIIDISRQLKSTSTGIDKNLTGAQRNMLVSLVKILIPHNLWKEPAFVSFFV